MSPRRWALAPTTIALLLALLGGLPQLGEAQRRPEPRVFTDAPAARWISHPTAPREAYGVFHFRRTFELVSRPEHFVVHVSADNRYRLFVNGQQVSSGPQRSDLMHWRYETVDLAPHLRPGRNVLAALVWNWGPYRPVAQFSRHTAFLLQGDSEREAAVNSGPAWKVLPNQGYAPIPVELRTYYASPPGESVDGSQYPWGWQELDFADDAWPAAAAGRGSGSERTELRGTDFTGQAGGWQLAPRSIPPMEEKAVRFARVRRTSGIDASEGFLKREGDLVVPARSHGRLLLDQAHLTNAYAVLETSGGKGSTISLTYAEALKDKAGLKGNRNEIDGKTIEGVKDVFRPDGGEHRSLQTLWFRTYRYVELEVETQDAPLRIHDLARHLHGLPVRAARALRQRPGLACRPVGDGLARRPALRMGDLFRHALTTSSSST